MTQGELIAAVRRMLDRDTMPDSDVLLLLRTAHGEIDRRLREHPRNRVLRPWQHPEGGDRIPLPDNCGRIENLYTSSSEKVPRYPNLEKWQRPGWVDGGDCLWIGESPAQIFLLDYRQHLVWPDSASGENWVMSLFPDVYLYGALKEASVFLKDDARLALWRDEFRVRVGDVFLDGWESNVGAAARVYQA